MSEQKKFVPFVASETSLPEFTIRALIIGLVLAVILGAANAYLGLKAGMTIAATYPAAVLGMAILKLFKGSILEENFTRTVGSIGESVAAGAIFTLPAFFIWKPDFQLSYITASVILIAGGILGIMFVALLRRVMVEDADLVFPESVAASEIHKSGQGSGGGSKFLFGAMGIGVAVQALSQFSFFPASWERYFPFFAGLKIPGTAIQAKGGMLISAPGISPAYVGVGYIIGPKYASLNFSGGLLAWGLLTPIIYYFISPYITPQFISDWAGYLAATTHMDPAKALENVQDPAFQIGQIWRYIVRPIAIGGMLMGAFYTLYSMRKSLFAGLSRSISDVKKAAAGHELNIPRTEQDLKFSYIMLGIIIVAAVTFVITYFVFGTSLAPAIVAATLLIVLAFFFAAISGYLVGIIGSSNNPISGLTLTALVITALIMVIMGVDKDHGGVAAVLGVAALVCVAAAVAGEMLQDLKVGHILGGTPWKMQVGNIIGVVVSGLVMFYVLNLLNQADIAQGKMATPPYIGGFGSKSLPAPQGGLMAMLSNGIVGGDMAWPLIIVGLLMGLAFILMQVKSPMLVAVGMYLPLETTFAIFIGGIIKGIAEIIIKKKGYNEAQRVRIDNVGILLASGLIAGEALTGLAFAPFKIAEVHIMKIFQDPPLLIGLIILVIIGLVLIYIPLRNRGKADQPAPPSAGM
ncbi:MAG TPA: oligopeptide transporter, OPT family [Ignavibacteria bacterium]|nr:oligopeptide transporter, OPT family [Ignavibacteria bacterium]